MDRDPNKMPLSKCKACNRLLEHHDRLCHAHVCSQFRSAHLSAEAKKGLRDGIRAAFDLFIPRAEPILQHYPQAIRIRKSTKKKRRTKRADLLICLPTRKLFIDYTIGSAPGRLRSRKGSPKDDVFVTGMLARERESKKKAEYADFTFLGNNGFVAFAMDVFGALSPDAIQLIRTLTRDAKRRNVKVVLQRLWEHLSVAIIRGFTAGARLMLNGLKVSSNKKI